LKLASLKNGRDGTLVVVSIDLTRYAVAGDIAPTLQAALDNWAEVAPKLEALAADLEAGNGGEPFDQAACASPLPRAYQWADGSAYVNHVELVRKARGAEVPESFWTDPLMYQGGSDSFLGPRDDILAADTAWGIDLEGEVAVVTGDVPMGVRAEDAGQYIRLIMLVNDVSLRGLIPGELAKGFGCVDMTFDFGQLIAHAAKSRPLVAGSIIGSGTVSNKLGDGPGKPISEGGVGYSCIAEIRMIETIESGAPTTPFMQFGDRVRIEMNDADGRSIFGTIDQTVVRYEG
jgi:fumarylacetoacetate (FAA) hydrolase